MDFGSQVPWVVDFLEGTPLVFLCIFLCLQWGSRSGTLDGFISGEVKVGIACNVCDCRNFKKFPGETVHKMNDPPGVLPGLPHVPTSASGLGAETRVAGVCQVLSGDNQWFCEQLGRKVDALSGTTVDSLPQILCRLAKESRGGQAVLGLGKMLVLHK